MTFKKIFCFYFILCSFFLNAEQTYPNFEQILKEKKEKVRLGVLCMNVKVLNELEDELKDSKKTTFNLRSFYSGKWENIDVVLADARIGKTASAATTSLLINQFKVDAVIGLGLGGGLAKDLNRGDVIIADRVMHHDIDSRPFRGRYDVPLLGVQDFPTDLMLSYFAKKAAKNFLKEDLGKLYTEELLQSWGVKNPSARYGLVATGDQFVDNKELREDLRERIADLDCVEMEGAAIAQICYEEKKPFTLIRVISDGSNEGSKDNFLEFLEQTSKPYAEKILTRLLKEVKEEIL